MRPEKFTKNRSGELIKAPEGYWAFNPRPLPPDLQWDHNIVAVLSDADRAIGELAGVGRSLANPLLLINPFIRKEAVSSSKIEGTQSSLSDLLFFEAMPSKKTKFHDVLEVRNYVQALTYGLERIKDLPKSLRLIKEIHGKLMDGVRGGEMTPGEFRRSQNWIGAPGCTLNEASFVPPPPYEMNESLRLFEKFLHEKTDLPPLVRLAVIHYQFEAIHPFLDGNGRIGRLLITLLLCVENILPEPLLYLSTYFEKHRDLYYDRLHSVSLSGNWVDWIGFFLQGVHEQAIDAIKRSKRLLALREEFHDRVYKAQRSALSHKLVDGLFIHPVTTVSLTKELLNVTPRAAQANIYRLVDCQILFEITERKRDRIYVAREIINVVEATDFPES